MPKRSSNDRGGAPPSDENEAAFRAVQALTGELPETNGKNPAAMLLGRLGGLKGGPARAKKLSKKRRTAIARMAAKKRWSKEPPSQVPGSRKSRTG
jgi:hypothetical protein